tara:strand:- start:1469 stop:2050 length:582 start_codon:yes stop_codon:yes gene_type:complete
MANASIIGFGLRPIKKVGQNDNNEGLSEYNVAANSAAMFQNDGVVAAASGNIAVGAAGNTLIGSLNGVFFTDANTSKPTFANNLVAANTATDIVAFVNDDPYQMFEIRSNAAGASLPTDVFNNADMAVTAGVVANGLSRSTLNDATLTGGGVGSAQLKIVGLSRDPDNQDLTVAGTVWRVLINEHFLKATASI